jgi:uncharacterized protein (TIGR02270 family)
MMTSHIVPAVLEQHVEELTTLWAVRDGLCEAAEIRVPDLARLDERIAAHEDGCAVGGSHALRILKEQLAATSAGRVFGAAIVGFALNDRDMIAQCVALAEASPAARRGMSAALGWVEPARLRGIVKSLLTARSPFHRCLGLKACRLHGVDPGAALHAGLTDPDNDVRAEAYRTAGELGQADVLSTVPSRVESDSACLFWSAWSTVLLGDRTRALETLATVAGSAGRHRRRAFRLACQAMSATVAHEALRRLAADAAQIRWVIEGSGIVGNAVYIPWLITHMADPETARLAGAAFTLITGVDLAQGGLAGTRPEGFESGPNDDPDDPNVDSDPDDGLAWPDHQKIGKWWDANRSRFQQGTRFFMGAPVNAEHCIHVLKTGDQRQRILAAQHLRLDQLRMPLFNTSAPTRRQQRQLEKL